MNFPPVGNAVAEGRVEWANGKAVPEVAIGVVQQRVGTEPQILTHRIDRTGGAGGEQVVERGVGSGGKEGPILEHGALGQGGVTPQPIELRREVSGGAVGVFLGGGEPFGVAEDAVPVDVKAVVVTVEGQIAGVEGVEGRAGVS